MENQFVSQHWSLHYIFYLRVIWRVRFAAATAAVTLRVTAAVAVRRSWAIGRIIWRTARGAGAIGAVLTVLVFLFTRHFTAAIAALAFILGLQILLQHLCAGRAQWDLTFSSAFVTPVPILQTFLTTYALRKGSCQSRLLLPYCLMSVVGPQSHLENLKLLATGKINVGKSIWIYAQD